jgi:hypothetical protein
MDHVTIRQKARPKDVQSMKKPDLETLPFEQGVAYLVETYAMREDDARHLVAQIKASVERYRYSDE